MDMFKRNIGYSGTIKPETAFFSSAQGIGSGLVTGVQLRYEQQLTRTWSLFGNGTNADGGANVWLVAGDTSGSLALSALFGTGTVSLGGTGDLCAPGVCSLVATGASTCTGSGTPKTLTMNHCVPSSYGFTGQAGSSVNITQDVGLTFINMTDAAA